MRRGRPPTVDVDDLVRAAVAVIDERGMPGLTVRAVAECAGVSTMTVYRHVADMDHLLRLVPDALLDGVADAVGRRREPVAALREVANGVARVLLAHPGVVALFITPEPGPNMRRAAERCTTLLVDRGMTPDEAFSCVRAVVAQVIGESMTAHEAYDSRGVEMLLDGVRQRLAARPGTTTRRHGRPRPQRTTS